MSKKPSETLAGLLNTLSLQQKVLIGGTAVVLTILLIVVVTFLNEPSYAPLYTELSQEDASKVVEFLNSQKIQYKLDDNGRTVKVAQDKVYETRLSLAGKGIPTSGTIGYEVFDKSTMGMSEFMQKLNYKRALEGELARTILGQYGVDGARVHIVFPEKTIFREEQKPTTASIVLKLKDNFVLPKSNSMAIVNLVASAVEGLSTNNITLIDTKGRLLWKEDSEGGFSVSSSKQYEIKSSVENYLAQKAQMILDNVIGYGNSIVQVNADLNFNQVEKTMELYDPESQVVVSEQTMKTDNNGRTISDTSAQTSQNVTTNYEISKTIQKVIEGSGNVIRLSVAAVINDIPKTVQKNDKTEIVYEPRPADQIKKLEELVRHAVGIDEERNDQFSLVNLPFETKPAEDYVQESNVWYKDVDGISNMLLVVLAIGASIFILRGLMSKLKNEKVVIGDVTANDLLLQSTATRGSANSKASMPALSELKKKKELLPIGDIEDEISDEAIRKKNRQEKISNYVSKNPTEAAKLINAWLHEDES